jgi:hypothetical protein
MLISGGRHIPACLFLRDARILTRLCTSRGVDLLCIKICCFRYSGSSAACCSAVGTSQRIQDLRWWVDSGARQVVLRRHALCATHVYEQRDDELSGFEVHQLARQG